VARLSSAKAATAVRIRSGPLQAIAPRWLFCCPDCRYVALWALSLRTLFLREKKHIMGKIGPTEIILILAIILLLFGGKKIPELMRGLGRGVKEFKDASKGESSENKEQIENK
jgi:sec-independent protein translocase protein TatA